MGVDLVVAVVVEVVTDDSNGGSGSGPGGSGGSSDIPPEWTALVVTRGATACDGCSTRPPVRVD